MVVWLVIFDGDRHRMTFQEYIASGPFQRQLSDLRKGKQFRKWLWIGPVVGILLLIGALVCMDWLPEEMRTPALQTLGIVLGAVGFAVVIIFSLIGAKLSGRDDNGRRKPVYAVALLLYAREFLADGWHAENGLLSFVIEIAAEDNRQLTGAVLERADHRLEIDLSAFLQTLEPSDVAYLVLYGMFTYLDRSAVSLTAIRCSVRLKGKQGKDEFLYRNGKWTWNGRIWKGYYRQILRYARKKGICAD